MAKERVTRLRWLVSVLAAGLFVAGVALAPRPSPAQAQALSVETVVGGLATIWAVDFVPDGRIFLTERAGRIRTVRDGQLDPEPWLTLDEVAETGESGLLGLALDPEFAQNGYVYVAYTYAGDGGALQNRLVRLREDPATGRGTFDAVLLDDVGGGRVHDGGRVRIGPDGMLYWTMGDSGRQDLAQDVASPNGKILRLNRDGSIPANNPFPDSPVYSYGHRNPQGLAWQPGSGRLYAVEHGPSGAQSCCDELNLIQPGQNYGWPLVVGDQTAEGTVPPLLHSGPARSTVWAPGGATFVSGGPWAGSLVFVGLRGESLYRVTLDPASPETVAGVERHLAGEYGRLRDVAEGPDGALYVTTSNRDGRGRPRDGDDRLLRLVVR